MNLPSAAWDAAALRGECGAGRRREVPLRWGDHRAGGGPGGACGFGGRGGNALKAKFVAEPAFAALRDEARVEAKQAIYGSGAATTELARLKALVVSSGLMSPTTIDGEAAALLSRIQQLAIAP